MSLVEATTRDNINNNHVGMQNRHDETRSMIADAVETILGITTVMIMILLMVMMIIHDVIKKHGETVVDSNSNDNADLRITRGDVTILIDDSMMTMVNHTMTLDNTITNLL